MMLEIIRLVLIYYLGTLATPEVAITPLVKFKGPFHQNYIQLFVFTLKFSYLPQVLSVFADSLFLPKAF